MTTQKALCVKLDEEVLKDLDWECAVTGRKRNRCINIAVAQWIARLDENRRRKNCGDEEPEAYDGAALELGKYILENLTGEQHAHIRFSAKGVGCSTKHLMYRLIVGALEDFKKRPFSYL